MPATYPLVGTRVRWTNRGKTREGVVVLLDRRDAQSSHLAFRFGEVFGWNRGGPRFKQAVEVVEVDTINGRPRTRQPMYYHPRPQWLETAETDQKT